MEIVTDGATLVLAGQIDVRCTFEVRDAIYQHLEAHPWDVVVDLSGVESIDMTALRMLAVASVAAGREGHLMTLRGCGPAVRRMLHLSHLRSFLLVDDEVA